PDWSAPLPSGSMKWFRPPTRERLSHRQAAMHEPSTVWITRFSLETKYSPGCTLTALNWKRWSKKKNAASPLRRGAFLSSSRLGVRAGARTGSGVAAPIRGARRRSTPAGAASEALIDRLSAQREQVARLAEVLRMAHV